MNTTNDSATVYLARSADGGNTWMDYRVSNRNFKPTPSVGLVKVIKATISG
ncbi:MAG: hypothetical protein AAB209_11275 [Bacteroidota bacterium]